jgi:hypothetical protein
MRESNDDDLGGIRAHYHSVRKAPKQQALHAAGTCCA